MTLLIPMHPFDQAIRLQPLAVGAYQAETSPAYANMVGPFGGVTCAVLLNAALQHPDKLGQPVALTVNFAAPIADGDYTVTARAARTNRSTQHWVIEASQASGVVALATAVFATRRPTWSAAEAQAPQGVPAPDSLVRMRSEQRPPWVKHYDMRFTQGDVFSGSTAKRKPIHARVNGCVTTHLARWTLRRSRPSVIVFFHVFFCVADAWHRSVPCPSPPTFTPTKRHWPHRVIGNCWARHAV